MLKYPEIKAEGVLFRENFINENYVSDNGGTLVLSPTISNGITTNGSTQYADYGDACNLGSDDFYFSFKVSVPSISTQTYFFSKHEDNNNRWYIRMDVSGALFMYCVVGGAVKISALSAVAFTENNKEYTITVVGDWNDTIRFYIDGVASVGSVTTFTNADITNTGPFRVGRWEAAYGAFTMKNLSIGHRALVLDETLDIYQADTFTEVDASKAVINLPLRTKFDDGSNVVTENIGTQANAIMGDGSTTNTMPELISPHGIINDALIVGTYMSIPDNANLRTSNVTVFALVKPQRDTAARNTIVSSGNAGAYATNNFAFEYINGTGLRVFGRTDGVSLSVSSVLKYNQWNDVAFTCDGTTTKIYANGEEVASSAALITGTDDTTGTYIGCANTGILDYHLEGELDAVQQFPFVCTPTQIKWLSEKAFRGLNV
jgi:hypothetical protein